MRHDEPATLMHLIKPLLLLLAVLVVLLIVNSAWGDGVRVYDVAGSDGPVVTLGQVAELEGDYANQFSDVIVGTFEDDKPRLELETATILAAMKGEGARLGMIDFGGYAKCVVHRTFNAPQRVASDKAEPAAANFDARGSGGGAVTIHTPTTVRSLIEKRIAEETGLALASLAVEFNERDEALLDQSAVAGRYEVEPAGAVSLGRASFRVQAYDGTREQGEPSTVTATVRQRVLAVIATGAIKRNELITRRRVKLSEVLIDDIAQPYLQETALVTGQIATTTVKPGELITSAQVALPVAVKRRSSVAVQYQADGIKITFNGVAHDEGSVGDRIEVENTLTKERFMATVVGRGKVTAGDTTQLQDKTQDKDKGARR